MTTPSDTPERDEIARVAHAIWEAEGRPEGRDHEHWMRAKQLIADGRADAEFPAAAGGDHAPRPVQPGFTDAAPGTVPHMKDDPGPELREGAGGRFATQLAELPEGDGGDARGETDMPGPRNPAPTPPTGADDGHATVPSVDEVTAGAESDDPRPPAAKRARR